MTNRRRRGFVLAATTAFGVAACASVLGLDDYTSTGDDGGPDAPPAPSSMEATVAPPPSDAAVSDVEPLKCATCIDPPAGWTPVVLASATATCPAGASPDDVGVQLEGPKAEGPCTCTCKAPPSNPCYDGGSQFALVRISGSGPGCSLPAGYRTDDTCRTSLGASSLLAMQASSPPPLTLPCAVDRVTPPTISALASYRTCTVGPGACPSGQVCGDLRVCLVRDGNATCPPGFEKAHDLLPQSAASDPAGCAPCSCNTAATACQDGKVSFYATADCNGAAVATLLTNGNCNALNASSATNQRYTATATPAGCVPDAAPVMTIPKARQRTVCCPP